MLAWTSNLLFEAPEGTTATFLLNNALILGDQ